MTRLGVDTYRAVLAADSQTVADLAVGRLDRPVPTCPGWSVADLLAHLGGVYSWAAAAVLGGGEHPVGRAPAPDDPARRVGWFLDRRGQLLDALCAVGADAPCWSFAGPDTTGWWWRRQVHETAVHRYDVQLAAGEPGSVDPAVATDGIDELLSVFVPGFRSYRIVPGLVGTLHFHCDDTDGEWTIDLTGEDVVVTREHRKADTAVRGPASDLYLWSWNRLPLERSCLDVLGRADVAAAWAGLTI